jgi:sialic acid synthase SpsE
MSKNFFVKNKKCFITAEIGNNHEGDYGLAKRLCEEAAEAGVDAVKFQVFDPIEFVRKKDEKRMAQMERFNLSHNQYIEISDYCKKLGIIFYATPFDIESAKFLREIQPIFKIASGDNNYFKLINEVASYKLPVIVSTGLLIESEIISFYDNWQRKWPDVPLGIAHCCASYPVPDSDLNLRVIPQLISKLENATIGFSDHSLGLTASQAAVAIGAKFIEKHFTLDHYHSDFRDHQLSANPKQMKDLVCFIRQIEMMLGKSERDTIHSEKETLIFARRSAVAASDIEVGTILSDEIIKWKRPQDGVKPSDYHLLIGRKVNKKIDEDDPIKFDDIS